MKKRKPVTKMGDEPVGTILRSPTSAKGGERPPADGNTAFRSAVGMQRPSLGDAAAVSFIPPVRQDSAYRQDLRQDYYPSDSSYRPGVPASMDQIPGPNAYYADTSYGRRRKGSQESGSEYNQASRTRQDSGGPVNLWPRQGAMPYGDSVDPRARQGSVPFTDALTDTRYQQPSSYQPLSIYAPPRSRKGSTDPLYSASSSPGGPFSPQFDNYGPSDPSRNKKPSTDAKQSFYPSPQLPFGSLEGQSSNFANYSNDPHDSRNPNVGKGRKDSLPEEYDRTSNRSGSADKTYQQYPVFHDPRFQQSWQPVTAPNNTTSPSRRPPQKNAGPQPRTRYPSEGELFPPSLNQRSIPQKQIVTNRPGINQSSPSVRAPEEQDVGLRSPQMPRMEGHRPSQDRGNYRKPPHDDSASSRAGFRPEENRPFRTKTPNPGDYRKPLVTSDYPISSVGFVPPPRSKTPSNSGRSTPLQGNSSDRRVDELGNMLTKMK